MMLRLSDKKCVLSPGITKPVECKRKEAVIMKSYGTTWGEHAWGCQLEAGGG